MPEATQPTRRAFLAASALAAISAPTFAQQQLQQRQRSRRRDPGGGPVVIASGNGLRAVTLAYQRLMSGADPLDAIVDGVAIIENDPDDMSVGLGGLPNEDGVVELDSCVMHGPAHRSGAVGALRNIRNPAAVAREVARRTDHCMIVGEGALRFARSLGFQEENLLTDKAREYWLRWKASLSREDDWLNEDQFDLPTPNKPRSAAPPSPSGRGPGRGVSDVDREVASNPAGHIIWRDNIPYTTGTIHCSALTAPGGDLAGCTTTSGLSWKLPGRVGDSPIIGAGNYTDNDTGSAGATGRGEAVIQISGARTVVMRMEQGDHPTDACIYALELIARKTSAPRLLDGQGRPNFNVCFYAVSKDGQFGAACFRGERDFAVATSAGARLERCATLYD
ncbi:MAG: N(4)-(beta-N-acetylglucosaminyl)-L-asparaginase [Phycisphaeraceae bacterium]|nr:N(4)-(beta-N-acetylglucosaminyl)-L-asparaginase [Phycisphaeraceae bacterium]MCB9846932.1 N(4)-(beta-N-acetylglucosaminyl)-L-asparaginase [Phycisphaeraceae bacterium]